MAFSMVGTFLDDPVRRLFTFLATRYKKLYQDLADWIFASDRELK